MPKIKKPTSQELHEFRSKLMERFAHSQTYDGEIFSKELLHGSFIVELKYTQRREFKSMECRVRLTCWNDYQRMYPSVIPLAKPIKCLSMEYVDDCEAAALSINQKIKNLVSELVAYK